MRENQITPRPIRDLSYLSLLFLHVILQNCCIFLEKSHILISAEITLKSVANTITYQEASSSCKSDGKELCSSKVICKDGKTPYEGVKSDDHWAPVADSFNEWIQIGKKNMNDNKNDIH